MSTYSFQDVVATLVGPTGTVNLGYGAAVAEEGITVEMAGDKNTMMIGSDGEVPIFGRASPHPRSYGTFARVLGRYVIQLALPALLFSALSQRSLGEVLQPTFLVAYALGSLFTIGTGLLWARRVAGKGVSASAIVAMGMACSNSGFVGFPMLSQLFGPVTAGAALAPPAAAGGLVPATRDPPTY